MSQQESLYVIEFERADQMSQEEFGKSDEDVRDFIGRCFKFKGPIKSVSLKFPSQDGAE